MTYLIDTSALVRLVRRQVDPGWSAVARRGLIFLCEPVLAETMLMAETRKYAQFEHSLVGRYPAVTVPDGGWDLVAALRRELAPHGIHRALSVADLVIAATARRLKLTVLHEDTDFETVARFVPEMRQHRISLDPEGARWRRGAQ